MSENDKQQIAKALSAAAIIAGLIIVLSSSFGGDESSLGIGFYIFSGAICLIIAIFAFLKLRKAN